jgi:hypothetical protein
MATVDKDFRVKHGLVVEGTTATVNGEDVLTTGSTISTSDLTEGTNLFFTDQRAVDAVSDEIDTAVTTAVDALDTDAIEEGETNLYFTDQRAIDAVGGTATSENTADTVVKRDADGNFAASDITVNELSIKEIGRIYEDDDNLVIENTDGNDVQINAEDIRLNSTDDIRLSATGDVVIGSTTGHIRFEDGPVHIGFPVTAENEVATKEYVTGAISDIDLTFNSDEITEGTTNLYFTNQRALDATSAAYDAAGAAATAEGNANDYTDTALESYTPTGDLDVTVGGYGYLKSADLSSYATESYVGTAVSNAVDDLVDGAPGLLDTLNEIANAIADDANYATTMTTALAGKQDELTAGNGIAIIDDVIGVAFDAGNGLAINGTNLTVDTNVIATKTYAEGVADTAEQNAKDYADTNFVLATDLPGQLDDYIPLTQKGAADGVATLDESGKVPATQLDIDVSGDISTAIDALTTSDIEEGSNLYFTDARAVDALEAVVPNFTAVEVNSLAKQVAATSSSLGSVPVTAYEFAKTSYKTAKFLVKISNGTDNEVTEVLLTLDSADNIAITEYAIVGTNGSRGEITADISGSNVRLRVNPVNDSTINVVGTLLA